MRLRDPLPSSVSWVTRALGYSVGAVAIAVAWYFAGNARLVNHYTHCMETQAPSGALKPTAMESAKALVACVEARTGVVEQLAFRSTKKLFANLPYTPCEYVGTWVSSRAGSTYQITLGADGEFFAEPVRTSDKHAGAIAGSWSVVGLRDSQQMVWLYEQGRVWPPDINPVQNASGDAFTLIERDGSRTQFGRVTAATCSAT